MCRGNDAGYCDISKAGPASQPDGARQTPDARHSLTYQRQVAYLKSTLMKFRKPPLRIQPTTLWDYPSQHYGDEIQGDQNYRGATPSYIIWNLLQRYTKERDLVVD